MVKDIEIQMKALELREAAREMGMTEPNGNLTREAEIYVQSGLDGFIAGEN